MFLPPSIRTTVGTDFTGLGAARKPVTSSFANRNIARASFPFRKLARQHHGVTAVPVILLHVASPLCIATMIDSHSSKISLSSSIRAVASALARRAFLKALNSAVENAEGK